MPQPQHNEEQPLIKHNEEQPLIMSVGCGEARQAVGELAFAWQERRDWRQLLESEELHQTRAVLLHPQALKHYTVTGALRLFSREWPLIDVIVWAPAAGAKEVRDILRAGAKEIVLSHDPNHLADALSQIVQDQTMLPRVVQEEGEEQASTRLGSLRSRSPKMWDIFRTCRRIAATEATVLLLGETGTGKELLARALHQYSGRSGEFVVLNCGAVAENLIDSELFGHVKGAFTGAHHNKMGLFRHADSGTILLDEVGNIPLEAQFRLLRVLQENTVRPVGGHTEIPVDVRVVAATNAPLEQLMVEGRFREDLYYRLNVINIIIPPLRQRKEDIIFLFAFFTKRFALQYELERPIVTEEFLDAMLNYDWPGNVRQLENLAERILLTHTRKRLRAVDFQRLTLSFQGKDEFGRTQSPSGPLPAAPGPAAPQPSDDPLELRYHVDPDVNLSQNINTLVEEAEKIYLNACLEKFEGRIARTAKHAEINRRTLLRKMKKYNMDKHDYRP